MTTMLQLIQQTTGEMGLSIPTFVAGNTAQDTIQQFALLNAVGSELQREFDWQRLQTEYRFTTQYLSTTGTIASGSAVVTALGSTTGLDATYMVSGTGINQDTYVLTNDSSSQVTLTQAATASATETIVFGKTKYSMPSDFDRQIDRTHYDKSKRWEMMGPETPQQWQWLKSSYISTGPRLRYRLMGGYLQIWPMMSTSEYIGFEYVSKNWVLDASNSGKSSFTVDTDTCIFPDRLMVLGLKAKYFEVKGFDSTKFQSDFEAQKSIAKAHDAGAKTISMAPQMAGVLITQANLPDSNYGQ